MNNGYWIFWLLNEHNHEYISNKFHIPKWPRIISSLSKSSLEDFERHIQICHDTIKSTGLYLSLHISFIAYKVSISYFSLDAAYIPSQLYLYFLKTYLDRKAYLLSLIPFIHKLRIVMTFIFSYQDSFYERIAQVILSCFFLLLML